MHKLIRLSSRTAFIVFVFTLLFLIAQAVWWFIFMERLVDEKIELSRELDASTELIESIQEEEKSRQQMLVLEGGVFFLALLVGLWLVYASLVRQQMLRRQQENFIMAVTHELKTPLASMNVNLDSLMSDDISEAEKSNLVPRIKTDVYRLKKQVDNILYVARYKNFGESSNLQEFNLSQMVKGRVKELGKITYNSDLAIKSDLAENIQFYGDRMALSRAIDAVLENAVFHNRGEKITVFVKLFESAEHIYLEISDNGIGIEKNDLESIFDRFYRAGDEITRRSQGTGLGLYICREIVNAHSGSIQAFSKGPSTGVKVVIKLKRRELLEKTTAG